MDEGSLSGHFTRDGGSFDVIPNYPQKMSEFLQITKALRHGGAEQKQILVRQMFVSTRWMQILLVLLYPMIKCFFSIYNIGQEFS